MRRDCHAPRRKSRPRGDGKPAPIKGICFPSAPVDDAVGTVIEDVGVIEICIPLGEPIRCCNLRPIPMFAISGDPMKIGLVAKHEPGGCKRDRSKSAGDAAPPEGTSAPGKRCLTEQDYGKLRA